MKGFFPNSSNRNKIRIFDIQPQLIPKLEHQNEPINKAKYPDESRTIILILIHS